MQHSTNYPQPAWIWPRAAYVHVPFCAHHCSYCDFAVTVGRDDAIDAYLDALEREIASITTPQPVRTIYIGGGTPTYLSAKQLDRLFRCLSKWLVLVPSGEFSIEANPSSITPEKVRVLAENGINRVSLGAQTFHQPALSILERDHDPGEITSAVDTVRQSISNVSLDLIFGTPGQTLDHLETDLIKALELSPTHVSTYGLTYEKGTRLFGLRAKGKIVPVDEEVELAFYKTAIFRLGEAGFEHYEISSHALPGSRCRHNEAYWANEAYFGFGLGAASYINGRRAKNTSVFNEYLRTIAAGLSPVVQAEHLGERDRALETMALQLRRMDGISFDLFARQTGFGLQELVGGKLEQLRQLGLLDVSLTGARLNPAGKYVADSVIEALLGA